MSLKNQNQSVKLMIHFHLVLKHEMHGLLLPRPYMCSWQGVQRSNFYLISSTFICP
jgi:hypothetical protein